MTVMGHFSQNRYAQKKNFFLLGYSSVMLQTLFGVFLHVTCYGKRRGDSNEALLKDRVCDCTLGWFPPFNCHDMCMCF